MKYILLDGIGLFVLIAGLITILFRYNFKVTKEVKKLTSLVDKINHRNYELDLESYNEDELSILKSEIYKTTLMLKESAENSLNDKVNLKNSLSDISHQLKTPLTSILIMLDAIIDDKDMDKNVRESFIKDIKREILNINFLVQSILKLSKFEANTVKFINEKVSLIDIVKAAIKNVSTLCDLKNVKIEIIGNGKNKILCDFKWQVEAVTNILKNCVEHSFEEGVISVSLDENKVYSSITIKDSGKGISKEELPHIFERFYKGKNSSSDSIGIGLALSKSIIESNNGSIQVDSVEGEGSTFVIKFFQS